MSRHLVIETAGRACSIALFDNDKLIAERHEELGRGHAEALLPWIAALPDGGRADRITVGCGPGSFTGLRVGIAAARALGLGWNATVCGVSSLSLIAASQGGKEDILVAIEGGHGQVFAQGFSTHPLRPTSRPVSQMPADIASLFEQQLVIGNAATMIVGLRGFGEAREASAMAINIVNIPADLRNGPAAPIYGRDADARPAA